ncbi:MAG: hypothetical protein ABIJ20_03710 [Nanoarchaeota archaeon]|nr:hypothetical protein [Nanoarchaeota archaeon]MBU1445538.1 hypothetical protein [Nanoarchaeota archaeon]MBU2420637.1 hypothetical protein [Nanoarchaeota archaeon]MBU2474915.1 hypothetical protein [Nanoarchaeota archaeon]
MQKSIVELFTSVTCPHCPRSILMLKELERDDIEPVFHSVNSSNGREKAEEYKILSVPTFIITGPKITNKIGLKSPSLEKLNEAIDISQGLKEFPKKRSFWDIFKRK